MEDIIQEKISADHLLYVSLKYTKTCDVILNLILRWRKMIETSIDEILKVQEKCNAKSFLQRGRNKHKSRKAERIRREFRKIYKCHKTISS